MDIAAEISYAGLKQYKERQEENRIGPEVMAQNRE